MLEAVSAPLRAYLKGRADTVRQIVTSLTDPEASELLEVDGGEDGAELLQEDVPDEECVDASEARGDEKAMLAWTPDPWQADPEARAMRIVEAHTSAVTPSERSHNAIEGSSRGKRPLSVSADKERAQGGGASVRAPAASAKREFNADGARTRGGGGGEIAPRDPV